MNIDVAAVDSLIRKEQCRPPSIIESRTCAITPVGQDTPPIKLTYYTSQRMGHPPNAQETRNSVATFTTNTHTDNSPCNICPDMLMTIEHGIDSLTPIAAGEDAKFRVHKC